MKIGYVVKRYPRFSETFVVNEILEHEAAGFEVEVFALRPPVDSHFQAELAKVRAPVTYLKGGNGRAEGLWSTLTKAAASLESWDQKIGSFESEVARDVCQGADLAIEARNREVDHLHAHFASSATSVARVASLMSGVPYSFTAHAKDIFHEDVSDTDLGRKMEAAHCTVTVSNFNREHLQQLTPASSPQIERIYNGLPLNQFPFSEPLDRRPVILAVGRLVEKKGFDDLVRACADLRERGVNFHCKIIGGGELSDALAAQIRDTKLEDQVQLCGALPREQVLREMQGASLVAAPCVIGEDGNRDGMPTVLLEAMALGTPVVAARVTGTPELVEDEKTGLLIDPGDVSALSRSCERLLASSSLRLELARAGRARIESDFDVRNSAAALRAFFRSAASRRPNSS